MNPISLKQGSEAWHAYRLGKITGSRVKDVMDFRKDGQPGAKRTAYMMELLCERLTKLTADHYVNDAMRWGQEQEGYAVTAYELMSGNDTQVVGISQHPRLPYFCASVDRFVGEYGLLEVKNPTTAKHVQWTLDDKVPDEHLWQCVAELACEPSRDWNDFFSHDSRMPLNLQNFEKRLMRNQEQIDAVEAAVETFEGELQALIASLNGRFPPLPEISQVADPDADLYLDSADIDRFIPLTAQLRASLEE